MTSDPQLSQSQNEVSTEESIDKSRVFNVDNVNVYYGSYLAVRNVTMDIYANEVTALIGPSGCGKSTILRCFNRLNDLIPGAKIDGKITYHGKDLYAKKVDPVEVRRSIGMVFQKPNPFPKSIYENIAFGARINGYQGNMDELVETSLKQAALWDEVKDKLKESGLSLSGGQQQRVAIARCLMQGAQIILADEPIASLVPESARKVMELLTRLNEDEGITVITSLHQVQMVRRYFDRAVALRDGIVRFDGATKDLNDHQLSEIYGSAAEELVMSGHAEVFTASQV